MNYEDLLKCFNDLLKNDPSMSEAIAAIQCLLEFITVSPAETLVHLREDIKQATELLTKSDRGMVTAISSGCELFLRFITLATFDYSDFKECRRILVDRGHMYLQKVASSREKIAKVALPFIGHETVILTHSKSRVVLEILKEAAQAKKRFRVYVTESMPDRAGHAMNEELTALGIPSVVILDSAVGYIMEKVDMVLVGAEGVVESGGIINKIGTYTIALAAQAMNKPFYVVAESFKFARMFPLNQADVPNHFKYPASKLEGDVDLSREHPMVDYTPPSFLTLLFTDLGVLTPSAVSDELIKLYL